MLIWVWLMVAFILDHAEQYKDFILMKFHVPIRDIMYKHKIYLYSS